MTSTPASTPPERAPLPSTCPRCGAAFACGAATGVCDCFALQVPPTVQADLARRWPGRCLCLDCLRELSSAASA